MCVVSKISSQQSQQPPLDIKMAQATIYSVETMIASRGYHV